MSDETTSTTPQDTPPATPTAETPEQKASKPRTSRARAKSDDGSVKVRHLEGCPESRLETYDTPDKNGKDVTVTRCIDCGAQKVHPKAD